jgi:hypothetical protein
MNNAVCKPLKKMSSPTLYPTTGDYVAMYYDTTDYDNDYDYDTI